MKLWKFGKLNNETSNSSSKTSKSEQSISSRGVSVGSNYECLWIPVCITFAQILPTIDLFLCINEHGEIALMALPDLTVSMTWGKILYKNPTARVVLIQQIKQGKDQSYLAPVTYTSKQSSCFSEITSHFNRGELGQGLLRHNWAKVISEVRENNVNFLNHDYYYQKINRIKISDIKDPRKFDDNETLNGYNPKVPIFLYTDQNIVREMSREELLRELFARQYLAEGNVNYVISALKNTPGWETLPPNDPFIGVINKVEVELKLHMQSWPSFADILLNPEMSEFIPGPPHKLKLTPKGTEVFKETHSRELRFSVSNWGEPNIAQVVLHIIQSKGQSMRETITSPAITVFRDDMGIHVLPANLFRITTALFSLSNQTGKVVNIDTITASEIPEISWKPATTEETSEWWQTNIITRKVLWIAIRNLASHLIGNPDEVICSVTPIGKDVVQVALLFDKLEEGAPYAFAIIRDKLAIRAIPVFPEGTYETKSNGTLVTTRKIILKNYVITNEGERIQSRDQILQFTAPIFAIIMGAEYKEPQVYETGGQ
jgi:hypothetical protein